MELRGIRLAPFIFCHVKYLVSRFQIISLEFSFCTPKNRSGAFNVDFDR